MVTDDLAETPADDLGISPAGWAVLNDPIWVFDPDRFRVIWANDAGLAFWRAPDLDALRGRDMSQISDVARARLHDYLDRFDRRETVEANWTLYPLGKPEAVRCRFHRIPSADGRRLILIHALAVGDDAVRGRDGPASDTLPEELREARDKLARAEARFRAFAEAGSDWLWETDREHRFVYMSTRVENFVGRPTDWFLGRTRREVAEMFDVDTRAPDALESWRKHEADLEAHRSFRDFEYVFRDGNGGTGFCSVSGDPVFDSRGRFLGYRGIARDVTRRVEAEQRIREMERERDVALAANAVSNQLIATMSHELRTPLNAILGFSEIMSGEILGPSNNPTYRAYAQDIFNSARHLLGIVDDLLNLSRVDIGTADRGLDIERFDADDLFDDVMRMTRPLVSARDLTLECEMDENALEIEADMRTIRQVLLNLIANAIKFSTTGGTITIGCACNEDRGISMFVRDTGRGIDPAQLPYVFEPFRTGDPHVARDSGGTGLGLWICRRIVDAHGGRIEIDSTPGAGTTVSVHLPAGTCVPGSGEPR